jgi:hypothetical protein
MFDLAFFAVVHVLPAPGRPDSHRRQQWLTIGFEQGRPGACDTFGVE